MGRRAARVSYEQGYTLSETQPLDFVLDDFRRTSQAVYRLVAGLRNEDLTQPRPLLTTGDSLASLVLDLAYEPPRAPAGGAGVALKNEQADYHRRVS